MCVCLVVVAWSSFGLLRSTALTRKIASIEAADAAKANGDELTKVVRLNARDALLASVLILRICDVLA